MSSFMSVFFTLLGFSFQSAPFVVAIVLGLLLPFLAIKSYSRFGYGVGLITLAFLFCMFMLGDVGLNLGIYVYYKDIVLGFIFMITAARFVLADDVPRLNRSWLVFCLAVALSTVIGLASYGTTAGVQVRGYFYFVAAALYAMSFPMTEERVQTLFKAFAYASMVAIFLIVYRWIVYYTPISSLLPPGGVYNVDGAVRVISADETLLLAEFSVLILFFAKSAPVLGFMRILLPVFWGMVLLLQHRSVWLAALVGVVASFAVARSQRSSAWMQGLLLVSMAVILAMALATSSKLSNVSQDVSDRTTTALKGQTTTGERWESWGEMLKKWYRSGPVAIAIGLPFGSDSTRYVHADSGVRKINYIAHNMYVQHAFNIGLLGFVSYMAVLWQVLRGLYGLARSGRAGVQGEALLVLVLMQSVYYIAYGADYVQGLILGVALMYLLGRKAALASSAEPGAGANPVRPPLLRPGRRV
jgi:hypothetical protein